MSKKDFHEISDEEFVKLTPDFLLKKAKMLLTYSSRNIIQKSIRFDLFNGFLLTYYKIYVIIKLINKRKDLRQ